MINKINGQGYHNLIVYLLKKWWLFLIVAIAGGIAGVLFAGLQKIKYESKLTFVIDDNEKGLSGASSLAAELNLNLVGQENPFSRDNIIEIIKSHKVVESVFFSIDSFENKPYTLIEYYWENDAGKSSGEKINFPPGITYSELSPAQRTVLTDLYSKFLKNSLVADRPNLRLWIYELNVISTNEKFCKVFTERLVIETNRFYTNISTLKAKESVEVLENQVNAIKANLSTSLSNKAGIKDNNLNPAFSIANVPASKQQANIDAYGKAYEEIYNNLEFARYQYLRQEPLLLVIDAADYPLEKIKKEKLAKGFWFAYLGDFILLLSLLGYKIFSYTSRVKIN